MVDIKIDIDKYDGCASCVDICPVGIFEIKESKSNPTDADECLVCRACEAHVQTTPLKSSSKSFIPLQRI